MHDKCSALTVFHAVTGCDRTVSSLEKAKSLHAWDASPPAIQKLFSLFSTLIELLVNICLLKWLVSWNDSLSSLRQNHAAGGTDPSSASKLFYIEEL